MALQGTLDTFALADLVRLLATTSKTGELVIDGDRGTGRLWFADGILVGGEPAGEGGSVDALFALLRFQDGEFRFQADIAAPEAAGVPGDAVALLAEAEERIEAWRPIEAVVPSPQVTLALRAELGEEEVRLDRDQWRLATTIAGGTTAGEVAQALGLDEVGAATRIKNLVDAGAVEVGADAEPDPEGPAPGRPVLDGDSELHRTSSGLDGDEASGAASEDAGAPVAFEPVEVVDPLAEIDAVEVGGAAVLDDAGPVSETGGEPRPTLRSLSRPEPDPDTAVNGSVPSTGGRGPSEPLLSFEGAIDPDDDAAVTTSSDPTRPARRGGPGGSTEVDLDAPQQGDPEGHRYLGATDAADGLPEPLPTSGPEASPAGPEASSTDPVAALGGDDDDGVVGSSDEDPVDAGDEADGALDDGEAARAPWPSPPSEEELAMQLDALSPAAARAVAAAASNGEIGGDSDAGRKVLRRIISSGG